MKCGNLEKASISSSTHTFLDHTMDALVVTIRRRADRRKAMLTWLPSDWRVKFTHDEGISWDEKDALQWRERGLRLYEWQISHKNPWWSRPLRLGEIGCAMTHYECWKVIKKNGPPRCIIFEDDCAPGPDFKRRTMSFLDKLERCDKFWDFAYLGRAQLAADRGFLFKEAVRPGYSYCTYAYAVSARGVSKLLDYGFEKMIFPIDEFIPATFLPHPREDIRKLIEPRLNAYAAVPDIYFQQNPELWGSDTESTPFVVSAR